MTDVAAEDYDADLDALLAQYETTVEKTAPPPPNPCACRCLRCVESRNRKSAA